MGVGRTVLEKQAKAKRELLRRQELALCREGSIVKGLWIPGPLYWLHFVIGDDDEPAGVHTFDERWQEKRTEPFPRFPGPDTLPYLPWVFSRFLEAKRLFLEKSRDMMATWCAIGYAAWSCQFFSKTRVIVQTQKEEKVFDLIKGKDAPGYARTLYERQPVWLQQRHPLSRPMELQSQGEITWANGSVLMGVPKGADQIRQYHPTLVIFDEAAHLDEFQPAYGNADLVASQVIAVSSAGPSWFGDVCSDAKQAG